MLTKEQAQALLEIHGFDDVVAAADGSFPVDMPEDMASLLNSTMSYLKEKNPVIIDAYRAVVKIAKGEENV